MNRYSLGTSRTSFGSTYECYDIQLNNIFLYLLLLMANVNMTAIIQK